MTPVAGCCSEASKRARGFASTYRACASKWLGARRCQERSCEGQRIMALELVDAQGVRRRALKSTEALASFLHTPKFVVVPLQRGSTSLRSRCR
nr:hypothetical protein [Zea mays]